MLCCWTSWLSLGFACDIQVLSEQQLLGVGDRSTVELEKDHALPRKEQCTVCERVVVRDGGGGWSFTHLVQQVC